MFLSNANAGIFYDIKIQGFIYTMLLSIDVGIKNLAICGLKTATATTPPTITLWKIINLTYGTDPCSSLIKALDELTDSVQDATIVIERQMTRKMCAIQCYLEMYYRLKNHAVIIYSPKYKLAGTGKEYSGAGKGLYHARKRASVQLSQAWLLAHPQEEWVTTLWKNTKKKDDLSDTLMMALAYQDNPQADVAKQPLKKICARKPTAAQEKRGKYTKSSIKYLLQQMPAENRTEASMPKKLLQSIHIFWPDVATCLVEIGCI